MTILQKKIKMESDEEDDDGSEEDEEYVLQYLWLLICFSCHSRPVAHRTWSFFCVVTIFWVLFVVHNSSDEDDDDDDDSDENDAKPQKSAGKELKKVRRLAGFSNLLLSS